MNLLLNSSCCCLCSSADNVAWAYGHFKGVRPHLKSNRPHLKGICVHLKNVRPSLKGRVLRFVLFLLCHTAYTESCIGQIWHAPIEY